MLWLIFHFRRLTALPMLINLFTSLIVLRIQQRITLYVNAICCCCLFVFRFIYFVVRCALKSVTFSQNCIGNNSVQKKQKQKVFSIINNQSIFILDTNTCDWNSCRDKKTKPSSSLYIAVTSECGVVVQNQNTMTVFTAISCRKYSDLITWKSGFLFLALIQGRELLLHSRKLAKPKADARFFVKLYSYRHTMKAKRGVKKHSAIFPQSTIIYLYSDVLK